MGKSRAKFTDKEEKFIQQYIICMNGAEAARRAGYAHSGARQEASRLLTNADIYAEIQKRREALRNKHEVKKEEIVRELKAVAFSNLKAVSKWSKNSVEVFDSDDLDEDASAAIKKVKQQDHEHGRNIEIELHDKISSLEKISKLLGYLSDKPGDDQPTHSPTVTELLVRFRNKAAK